ncbi:MAG: hypothetical protein A2Z20_06840 [Bdellovibrionales bacterium RBG_16_40_8]|nr:MAG: hypothetical protein A2Z20_06840 [Bdellovibrionales bacterium RBG_16_40_8]
MPASGGEHAGITRTQIATQFIEAFKKHKGPGVYGFVNGILAKNMAERAKILQNHVNYHGRPLRILKALE